MSISRKRPRRASPGDPRIDLERVNHIAKNANKDVAKGTKLQIKIRCTPYNATVTKGLNDELVKVCTKAEDQIVAKTEFKIVRLTKEQAKSGKPSGFTNKKANVGFPVEGAHDE